MQPYMGKRLKGVFFLALMLANSTQSGTATDFKHLVIDGSVVKWGEPRYGQPAVVHYAFADGNYTYPDARNCSGISGIGALARDAGVSEDVVAHEAVEAFAAWEAVANIRFVATDRTEDAEIVIGAQTKPRGYAFTNVWPKVSSTEINASIKGKNRALNLPDPEAGKANVRSNINIASIDKALICLNPEKRWKVGADGDPEIYDLRYTFMHEIGHAIGLDHVGQSGFLMNFRYNEVIRGPQPGDVLGAEALYGAPKNRAK